MSDVLALFGGTPVRGAPLPYGRQSVDEDDVRAVADALRSDWLTTGPRVEKFEKAFLGFSGGHYAAACSNGTAALHLMYRAVGIGPGDEVIVPALTFVATANAVLYAGGTPVFADVSPLTGLIDPEDAERKITSRTKAIVAVDYAGQPADYSALGDLSRRKNVLLLSDSCHSPGALWKGKPPAAYTSGSAYSFHPVKHLTTAEGGMVVCSDETIGKNVRRLRNHGIDLDMRERERRGMWSYDMVELGYNYRLPDVLCALGTSQLTHLEAWVTRRREIAARYDLGFMGLSGAVPTIAASNARSSYHLYVLKVESPPRDEFIKALRAENILATYHYGCVHLHSYYRKTLGTGPGLCPHAEKLADEVVSLPIFPAMNEKDVEDVITAVKKVLRGLPKARRAA